MSVMTKLASWRLNLPPATTPKLEYQIDLKIPMPDGVVLLANRIAPIRGEALPIILVRNPYTPRGKKPDLMSQLLAERGYQVVMQNCRGRWGSGGEFQPFQHEREDGLATLQWISEQPWFSGSVGMFGVSYWAYVQLALAPDAPDFLKAIVPQMGASRNFGAFRPHGTLGLDVALTWHYQTFVLNASESAAERKRAMKKRKNQLAKGFEHLPLKDADRIVIGFPSPFYQDLIRQDKEDDPIWAATGYSEITGHIKAPVHFICGWYDFFLADQLADYQSLRNVGKEPYLTIGPWTHGSVPSVKPWFQESLAWYEAHLKGNDSILRHSPVRIYVMGIDTWIDLASWPPRSHKTPWYLQGGGLLSQETPADGVEPSRYRYNPADPTPNVGGSTPSDGGPKDNRRLEGRPDVLTFTSEPMRKDMTIIGSVSAELYVRSTNEHTDFFTRLCDVAPKNGKSVNLCDGIVRITPRSYQAGPNGIHRVTIDLTPIAHCFKTGHRIRLQVSSGAHPMFARNLGTGEPIATGTRMQAAKQEVFHDTSHLSAIVFPVVSTPE